MGRLEQARSGDIEAFGEIVREYQDGIYQLLLGLVSSPEEARDLAAETFARAWRSLSGFRGGSDIRTWLWRIALNLSRSHLRRRYLGKKIFFWRDRGEEDDGADDADSRWADRDPGADPEKASERECLRSAVREARAALSPREGEVFTLKHDRGLKISEIGALLSLSENTVKVLLFRASKKMAERLRDFAG